MVSRRRAAVVILLTVSVALLGGFAVKNRCLHEPWVEYSQYQTYCDSDMVPLYEQRGFDRDAVAYAEEFTEYPVWAGAVTCAADHVCWF